MALKGFEKKDPMAGLNQLMQLMNQMDAMGQRQTQRSREDSISFQNRVNNVRTLDALTNILPSVNDHNKNLELSGNEEFNVMYSDKHNAYKNASMAYEKAKSIQDENLKNPDILTKKLVSGGWEGAAAGIRDIDNLLDDIDEGDAYKFRYARDEKYSQSGLRKALETRQNAYRAVAELLDDPDNAESFLAINPDGTMDEETAILLEKLKLNIVTGDIQEVNSTVQVGTTKAISDFRAYDKAWVKWNKLNNKILASESGTVTASDAGKDNDDILAMIFANGLDETSPLEAEFITRMMGTSADLADKANVRHKVFTGQLYNESPVWKVYEFPEDLNEIGMGETNVVIGDLNKNTQDTSTVEEVTPAQKIVEKGPMSQAKPQVGSLRYKELKSEKDKDILQGLNEEESFDNLIKIDINDLQNNIMSLYPKEKNLKKNLINLFQH